MGAMSDHTMKRCVVSGVLALARLLTVCAASGQSANAGGAGSGGGNTVAPGAYRSPYVITYGYPLTALKAAQDTDPADARTRYDKPGATWTVPGFDSWYDPSAYKSAVAQGWGPRPGVFSPVPYAKSLGGTRIMWQRDRVLYCANSYRGLGYQHHHVPDWNPSTQPAWPGNLTDASAQTPGLDCSNFTSWVYNFALGIHLDSNTQRQSATGRIDPPAVLGLPVHVYVPALASSRVGAASDYDRLVTVLRLGDLVFIRSNGSDPVGKVGHVVMWVGPVTGSPDPLVIDAHANRPPITDVNGTVVPLGVGLRPFRHGEWYHRNFDHAVRIIYDPSDPTK